MLPEFHARFSKIVQQKKEKAKLSNDLTWLEKELEEKSLELDDLQEQLAKEEMDVEKLSQLSLVSLFQTVLGNREQQLEKERQEMLAAQLKYQRMKSQVDYLRQDLESVIRKLNSLQGIENEYEQLLADKEQLLRRENSPIVYELLNLSEIIGSTSAEIRELEEAINAGKYTIEGLDQVIELLRSAENWGTWDLLGGGLLSTAMKHSRIDEARQSIHEVQNRISQLKRELTDIQNNAEFQINISEFDTFADFFFDGLIFDWVVQSKINESLNQTKKTKKAIQSMVSNLTSLKNISHEKIEELQQKRNALIEQA